MTRGITLSLYVGPAVPVPAQDGREAERLGDGGTRSKPGSAPNTKKRSVAR